MPAFSTASQKRLATCHPDLQRLFNAVIEQTDCTILCGHRTKEEQEEAFLAGKSHVQFPESRHNSLPSQAVDVMPYPIDWDDANRVTEFYRLVKRTADELGIRIRWGADWDGDGTFWERENWEVDGPHYELGP